MKELTYEDWLKNPIPRMMWVWDNKEEEKIKRKVIYFNDEKAIFRTFYKVIDVFTHYSENKAYKNISVQYSVILRKE